MRPAVVALAAVAAARRAARRPAQRSRGAAHGLGRRLPGRPIATAASRCSRACATAPRRRRRRAIEDRSAAPHRGRLRLSPRLRRGRRGIDQRSRPRRRGRPSPGRSPRHPRTGGAGAVTDVFAGTWSRTSSPQAMRPRAAREAWDRFKDLGSARGMVARGRRDRLHAAERPGAQGHPRRSAGAPDAMASRGVRRAPRMGRRPVQRAAAAPRPSPSSPSAVDCFQRGSEFAIARRDRCVSLGRVYRLHGRLTDALAQYRAALALHEPPGSPIGRGAVQAMNAIAVTLSMMGRYDEAGASGRSRAGAGAADRAVDGAVLRRPTSAASTPRLGRYAEALALLDEAIAGPSGHALHRTALSSSGPALAELGRRDEALAVVRSRRRAVADERGPKSSHRPAVAARRAS